MAEAGSPAPPLTDLERLRFLVVADLISAILLAGALFYRRREYKRLRTLLREKSLHAVDERFSLEAFTAVLTPVWPIPSSRYRVKAVTAHLLRFEVLPNRFVNAFLAISSIICLLWLGINPWLLDLGFWYLFVKIYSANESVDTYELRRDGSLTFVKMYSYSVGYGQLVGIRGARVVETSRKADSGKLVFSYTTELVLIGTGPAIPLFTEFGAPKAVVAEAINIFLWKAPSLRPPAQVEWV